MDIPITLALGANLGDPVRQLTEAVRGLGRVARIGQVSDVYITEPVGIVDQPQFYNLVLTGTTSFNVYALQGEAQRLEEVLGRVRGERNGPRIIDIDLLAYGELVLNSPSLTVPHARLQERAFVLGPLAEIEPGWQHPLSRRTARELLHGLAAPTGISRWGPLPRPGGNDGGE